MKDMAIGMTGAFLAAIIVTACMLTCGCESGGGDDTTITVVVTNPVTQAPIRVDLEGSSGNVITIGNNNRPNVDNSQQNTTETAPAEEPEVELVPVEQ